MREAIVDLQFDDLGIDQDQAEIVRAEAVEQAEQERVDADGFSGTGGAGDEGVREIGEVVDQGGAVDILTEGNGEVGAGGVPFFRFDQVTEKDFDLGGIGDFDGDGVATRNGGKNIDAFGLHGAGQVALEIDDTFHANTRGGIKFVAGDGGSAGDVARTDLDVEMSQGLHDALLVRFEFVFGVGGAGVLL